MIKNILIIAVSCASGFVIAQQIVKHYPQTPEIVYEDPFVYNEAIDGVFPRPLRAGDYLASRHAQIHHDWKNAHEYVQNIINNGIGDDELLQRSMVLSMGAGDFENAIKSAHDLKENKNFSSNTMVHILLIVEAVKNEKYTEAEILMKSIPNDGMTEFIKPFLQGWIDAANGKLNIQNMQQNTVQLYHAILISGYLNDHTQMKKMIDHALAVEDITADEIERIGDLYAHAGLTDNAIKLYERVQTLIPDNTYIEQKIKQVQSGKNEPLFEEIKSATQGLAKAFFDIANILAQQNNDETARVFVQTALYLKPDYTEAKFLLAAIGIRHEHYDEAISLYQSVPETDKNFMEAQYKIASVYEETDKIDQALAMLEKLAKENKNVDTYIKMGDLHRHQSNFGLAIKAYNLAVKELGGKVPDEYWHLHYALGISYEQADEWDRAEQELQKALAYKPDHPYVLNYLGYAWADMGINLDKALRMIQRASELRPSDGYITDSLGWIMYRNGLYDKAVSILERAVELLPYDPTINDHLGDAYWQVGRKLEAKFQWERAKNHAEDASLITTLEDKILNGLNEDDKKKKHAKKDRP